VYSIYAFARTADDFADEASLTPNERLERLDEWGRNLDECFAGRAEGPVFIALAETVRRLGIPREPFHDLLTAFRMDVRQSRFGTFSDLLQYCAFSANPVGRLVLHVFGAVSERSVSLSDKICTALQLANFWQDVSVDWQKGRIYIPLEDFKRFGYTEGELSRQVVNENFRNMMKFQVDRTQCLFREGEPLLREAPPSLRFELRLTLLGGLRILRKIEKARYNVLAVRPTVSILDKAVIIWKLIFPLHV
jgi:phytoene synthase